LHKNRLQNYKLFLISQKNISKQEKNSIFAKNKKKIMKTATMNVFGAYLAKAAQLRIIEGFTPRQRPNFENGISIQDYAREKGIKI